MAELDINIPFLLLQLLNLALLVMWVIMAVRALRRLGGEQLSEGERIVWVLVILVFPVLGAFAFLATHPQEKAKREPA